MKSAFTAFLHSQKGGETPDPELFHEAWNSLQAALGGELKRRGLWRCPPCYLGVYGYDRWDAEAAMGDPMAHVWGERRAGQSALGELVSDCWAYIFSDRHHALRRQLATKANIDGLVNLNIKHFLHERQREHDPVGFLVFDRLQGAVRQALGQRALYVLAGDVRIRNGTVLGFEPGAAPPLNWIDLRPVAAAWNDRLLPDLVTARGRQQVAVADTLVRLFAELPRYGVPSFRFKDLADPLKSDARQRWAALLAEDRAVPTAAPDGGEGWVLRQEVPESTFESNQSYRHLVSCVSAAIGCIETDQRTRGYLRALWDHLHLSDDDFAPGGCDDVVLEERRTLSNRQLGEHLQIPRERLPMLFTTLRQLAARCHLAGGVRLVETGRSSTPTR
jgi:hypothetical protein